MTSEQRSFPPRLTKIDALTRGDHHLLREEDECFFLGEYAVQRHESPQKPYSYGAINQLIYNFKIPVSKKDSSRWKYKERDIPTAACALHNALKNSDLSGMTFVPVPPSKAKSDPLYDDRMLRMLSELNRLIKSSQGYEIDVRELVTQGTSINAAHESETRPSPAELVNGYSIEYEQLVGTKSKIVICDDVLTTGSHYRAMCDILQPVLAGRSFRGLFLARRTPVTTDFSDLCVE
jgi:predicted amidophosphoribosyltransferase